MWLFDKIREKKQIREERCASLLSRIDTALDELKQVFSCPDRFVTDDDITIWKNKHCPIITELRTDTEIFKLKKAKKYRELTRKIQLLLSAEKELDQTRNIHNEKTANSRATEVYSVIGQVEGKKLDTQQLVAISKDVHTHLVLAGAGTGKTTTIVGLIKYLLKTGKYKQNEILVLSFTNASASEMKERISNETGYPIDASTFHKLGMNIITEVKGVKPKITELQQYSFIKQQLELLMQDDDYLSLLNMYMIRKQYLSKSEFDFISIQEYQDYLQKNPPVSLKQETMKSYGEVEIANFLYLNGIEYIYESPYKIDTRTKEFGQYKPDFYLPEYDIYIEYFGIDRNGNPPAYFQNDYVASIQWKRELHKTNATTMIETFAFENFEGVLTSELENKLKEKNVSFAPMSQEELWRKITEDNKNVLDGLIQLIETVINLMKSNRYDIDEMHKRNAHFLGLTEVSYLLNVISPIWNSYNSYLQEKGEIDFNDMINNAVDYIRDGKYVNKYKVVIVDEYQDISRSRYELLSAMRASSDYRLFCVGDDWQSIYRFNGSDIAYIQQFKKYWGPSEISRIETTYRFSQRLIDITSSFIMRNPMQLKKSIRGMNNEVKYVLGEVEGYTDKYAIEFMLNRLDELPINSSVFLIGRYTFDKRMLENNNKLTCKFDIQEGVTRVIYYNRRDLMIKFLTAHKSKGLQADYVFILNNKNGKTGFPSKIQDSPILDLLLEKSDSYPDAEERRLFYVAMTRARQKVILVTLKDYKSDFANELISRYAAEMKQEAFICPQCGGRLRKRNGKFGEFYGCENYSVSGCRYTRNISRNNQSSWKH